MHLVDRLLFWRPREKPAAPPRPKPTLFACLPDWFRAVLMCPRCGKRFHHHANGWGCGRCRMWRTDAQVIRAFDFLSGPGPDGLWKRLDAGKIVEGLIAEDEKRIVPITKE